MLFANLFQCMLRLTYFSISHKSPLLVLRNLRILNFCYKEVKNSLCDDRLDHILSVPKSVCGQPEQPSEVDLVLIAIGKLHTMVKRKERLESSCSHLSSVEETFEKRIKLFDVYVNGAKRKYHLKYQQSANLTTSAGQIKFFSA